MSLNRTTGVIIKVTDYGESDKIVTLYCPLEGKFSVIAKGIAGALKMQLAVTDGTTTWQSAVTDFDGSFNPGSDISIAWGNIYWQAIDGIQFKKEPNW